MNDKQHPTDSAQRRAVMVNAWLVMGLEFLPQPMIDELRASIIARERAYVEALESIGDPASPKPADKPLANHRRVSGNATSALVFDDVRAHPGATGVQIAERLFAAHRLNQGAVYGALGRLVASEAVVRSGKWGAFTFAVAGAASPPPVRFTGAKSRTGQRAAARTDSGVLILDDVREHPNTTVGQTIERLKGSHGISAVAISSAFARLNRSGAFAVAGRRGAHTFTLKDATGARLPGATNVVGELAAIVLDDVREHPGTTASQIATRLSLARGVAGGATKSSIGRLFAAGKLVRGGARGRVGTTDAYTYTLADAKRQGGAVRRPRRTYTPGETPTAVVRNDLREHPGATVAQIAARLNFKRSIVDGVMVRLLKAGAVSRAGTGGNRSGTDAYTFTLLVEAPTVPQETQ